MHPVVQGSGVLATEGREFPIGKTAGRSESEPISSLVNRTKMPTQWTCGEGRSLADWKTEAFAGIFRGSRGGMSQKMNNPVLETQCGDTRGISTGAYKVKPKSQQAVLGVGGVYSTL